jgi:hypothetical protein
MQKLGKSIDQVLDSLEEHQLLHRGAADATTA